LKIYQHYSFDLWLTLIRPNPSFKQERAKFFFDRFNHRKIPLEKIIGIFSQVDALCNAINEATGKNMDAEEINLMVIGAMNEYDDSLKEVDPVQLYEEVEALFLAYPPFVYDDKTIRALDAIYAATGKTGTFSILSNTAFIKGRTLRKILPGVGLEGFFHFELFSDEVGLSKPNQALFRILLNTVVSDRGEIDPTDIIHVGDNPIADEKGAKMAGISSFLINSNDRRLSSLVPHP